MLLEVIGVKDVAVEMVEDTGVEPVTSRLPALRSPN